MASRHEEIRRRIFEITEIGYTGDFLSRFYNNGSVAAKRAFVSRVTLKGLVKIDRSHVALVEVAVAYVAFVYINSVIIQHGG